MEDDPELSALRAKRMAELQQQMGGGGNTEQEKQRQEAAQREADMKNSILTQILDQSARARLNSIALVKPEKARMVESMLIQMAQYGQIAGKMDEAQLKNLIERVNKQTEKTTKVTISRRKYAMDSDEDDY